MPSRLARSTRFSLLALLAALTLAATACSSTGLLYADYSDASVRGEADAAVAPSPAALSIAPTTYDFGNIVMGSSNAAATFTVSNATGSDVSGAISIALSGTDAAEFQIVAGGTCVSGTTTLKGGETCTVLARFGPTIKGAKSASLDAKAAPGGTASAALTGTGLPPAVSQIALGAGHTCVRLTDGTVKCWGWNYYGQLGDGTTTDRHTPTAVSGLTDVAEIELGAWHTCARLTDGTVKCWANPHLHGDGTPTAVPALTDVVEIALGLVHTCARLTDGTAKCWGGNYNGQLGDGTTTGHDTPTAVSGLSGVAEIAVGSSSDHTCARLTDGTAKCWGWNYNGRLGDGTTTDRHTPTAVSGLTGVAEIALGDPHTCARVTDGTVKCWGYNFYGNLGDGTATDRHTPTAVSGLTGVAEIALGCYHTCARLTDGTAKCWGRNDSGQLGDGTTTDRHTPTSVPGLTGVVEIAAGGFHTCARLTDGTAKCWGRNDYGQLGDGTTTERHTPTDVVW